MSIVITPIKVIAFSGSIAAGAITAGSVWGAVAGGLGIGLAVGADAIADGLSNGTIDNRVEQWLWDKASEWEYGYTQAQVNGEVFKAELTYGDYRQLANLLSEAYPEGSFTVSNGKKGTIDIIDDLVIPINQPTYFTDLSQTGTDAYTYCHEIYFKQNRPDSEYASGPDLVVLKQTRINLVTGATYVMSELNVFQLPSYYGHFDNVSLQFDNRQATVHAHLSDIRNHPDFSGYKTNPLSIPFYGLNTFNDTALISTVLPTYIPGVGISADGDVVGIQDVIDALNEKPYGMSDDDVVLSIPVIGEGDITDRPGVVPDNDELIDDAPSAVIEGEFSGFTTPNGLMYVFPFSLPYDFYRGIKLFSSPPEVPEFTFNFIIPYPKGMGQGNLVDKEITLNFKQFEKLAIISRWISTFGFTMMLIKLSAFILKGGNA